jgi:predicted double-glycine peptidase
MFSHRRLSRWTARLPRPGQRGAVTVEFLALTSAAMAILAAAIMAVSGEVAPQLGRAVGGNIDCLIAGFDGGAGCGESPFDGGSVSVKPPPAGGHAPPQVLRPGTVIQRFWLLSAAGDGSASGSSDAADSQSWWQRAWSVIRQSIANALERLGLRDSEAAGSVEIGPPAEESPAGRRGSFADLLTPEAGPPPAPDHAPPAGQSPASGNGLAVPVYDQRSASITADTLLPSVRDRMSADLEQRYKLYGCVPTSVAMVMDYYHSLGRGKSAPVGEVMSRFEEQGMWGDTDGSTGTADQFSQALAPYGFRAEVEAAGDWNAALSRVAAGTPIVAFLAQYPIGSHAVVITGRADGRVYFNDPWTGTARSVTEVQFRSWWSLPGSDGSNVVYPYVTIVPKD